MSSFSAHAGSLTLAATLAALTACADQPNPIGPEEPPVADAQAAGPEHTTGPLEDLAYWADGYLLSPSNPGSASTPDPTSSFNRAGGAKTVTKVAGTTGRYVARFRGLSALLGTKSTVRVTGFGSDATYCKAVGAALVRDSVEVRCFKIGTGAATNARFSLMVTGKYDDRAFAYAHQPTATNYAPATAGSWNPAGTTKVIRHGVGSYQVVFAGFSARFPGSAPGTGGHAQVNAVGTGKAHCKVGEWGAGGAGSSDLNVYVGCYTPAGARADAKFTLLFTPPAAHLAYALADQPAAASYTPQSVYSSNPVGGAITITRYTAGVYDIRWTGVDAEIRDFGNVQVTTMDAGGVQCKVIAGETEEVTVKCFAPNGTPVDAYYTVLLHS
jgi:hypothetical protein